MIERHSLIVTKEQCIHAAATGDGETLRRYLTDTAAAQIRPKSNTVSDPSDLGDDDNDDRDSLSPARRTLVDQQALLTTLFHEAIENGQLASVRALLASSIPKPASIEILRGALREAIVEDEAEIVACLLQAATAHDNGTKHNLVRDLVNGPPDGSLGDAGGDTDDPADTDATLAALAPLSLAARLGAVEIAELLLDHGADVSGADRRGWTALHWAAWAEDPELLGLLVRRGAPIDSPTSISGETPLHVAIKHGHRHAVTALVGLGANVNALNGLGSSARHLARTEGQREIDTELANAGGALVVPPPTPLPGLLRGAGRSRNAMTTTT